MKRNTKWLSLLLVLALCLSMLPIGALADQTQRILPPDVSEAKGKLVVLHTNDVHARVDDKLGYAGLKARIEQYKAAGAEVLVVDAGDTLHGKPVAVAFEGKSIVDILNEVGYDAMTPGNHDFNYGYERLLTLREEMKFPLLSANVTYKDSGKKVFEENTVIMKGKYKIGIFGLSTVETATKTNPNNVVGLAFSEGEALYADAQAQVDALKAQGCDLIIALAHLGVDAGSAPNRSTDVIANTKGIDLLIDGHSHTYFPNGETHGDTLLASTGTELANIGEVIFDGIQLKAYSTSFTEGEDNYTLKDKAVQTLVENYTGKIKEMYGEKIGDTTVHLNGERAPGNRTQETNLGDLASDAIMYAAKKAGYEADIGLTNGGGIRTSIPVGPITKYNLVEVFPFGNQVVVFDITGKALLEALEANTAATPEAEGGFPQVAGIRFKIETGKTENRVTILDVGGKEFDPAATYTIATNDFIGAGGDKYSVFGDFYEGKMSGINLEDALIDYIQTELSGVVDARYQNPQGRVIVVPADVEAGVWYENAVYYVVGVGIMQGITENTFAVAGTVSRAQVYQTFYNMAGCPAITGENFRDVTKEDWFYDAALWAKNMNLSSGTGDGDFEGNRVMNRAELMQTFYNYMKLQEISSTAADLSQFADADTIPEWAQEAVAHAVGAKVISGKDNGTLDPYGTTLRCELAQIHYNFSRIGQ